MFVPPTILIATDLTARSDRAFDRAVELATDLGGTLLVAHALDKGDAAHVARASDRAKRVIAKLTEGVAVDDPHAAVATMDQLHARGVRMSMDDFGTGYSSLSQLKRFQIFKLKIDQSFVRDLGDDGNDRAIVSAIIRMAQALGMRTTAEGVETEGQLAYLREQGCDEAQGYHFSMPLSAPELEAFMRRQLH